LHFLTRLTVWRSAAQRENSFASQESMNVADGDIDEPGQVLVVSAVD
jgi:hypothetical protein